MRSKTIPRRSFHGNSSKLFTIEFREYDCDVSKIDFICPLYSREIRGLRSRCFTENDVRLSYVTYECL